MKELKIGPGPRHEKWWHAFSKQVWVIDHAALGAHFRERRKKASVSLRAMALHLNCSPMWLSDLETGKRSWREHWIKKYEDVLSLCAGDARFRRLVRAFQGENAAMRQERGR